MPPYRAQGGSGLFGSYASPDTRPKVDVGQILDAISSGTTGVIHQAMLRRQAQAEVDQRKAAMDLERERLTTQTAQANRDFTFRQGEADRDYGLKQSADTRAAAQQAFTERQADLENESKGYVPTTVTRNPTPGPMPTFDTPNTSAIGSALLTGRPAPTTPIQAPAAPIATVTPGHFDYGKSIAAQGEHQHLADELTVQAGAAKNAQELEGIRSRHELANKLAMIGPEGDQKVREAIAAAQAKFQYALPKSDDLKVAGLVPELVSTLKTIDQYDAPSALTKLGSKGLIGNYVISPEGQQFNQASDQFLQALAFARSGKRINDQEIVRMRDAYIPKPGDTDEVLAKKRAARQMAVQGTTLGAGRGASFINPDDLDYLHSKGYVQDGTAAAAPAPAAAAPTGPKQLGPGTKAAAPIKTPPGTYVSKYGITP